MLFKGKNKKIELNYSLVNNIIIITFPLNLCWFDTIDVVNNKQVRIPSLQNIRLKCISIETYIKKSKIPLNYMVFNTCIQYYIN